MTEGRRPGSIPRTPTATGGGALVLAAGLIAIAFLLTGRAAVDATTRRSVSLATLRPALGLLEAAATRVSASVAEHSMILLVALAAAAIVALLRGSPLRASFFVAAVAICAGSLGVPVVAWSAMIAALALGRRGERLEREPGPMDAPTGHGAGASRREPSRLLVAAGLALALLTTLVLRIERLDVLPAVAPDEPVFAQAALAWLRGESPPRFGLYAAAFIHAWWPHLGVAAGAMTAFGDGLVPARVASVALGLCTDLALFAIGRNLFGARVGWLAAMVYAVSPHAILLDRLALPYALSGAHGALVVWLSTLRRPWRPSRLLLVGALVALAPALYQPSFVLVPLVPIAIALLAPEAARRRTTWLYLLGSAIAVTALLGWRDAEGLRQRFAYTGGVAREFGAFAFAVFPDPADPTDVERAATLALEHGCQFSEHSARFQGHVYHGILGTGAQIRSLARARLPGSWTIETDVGLGWLAKSRAFVERLLWSAGPPVDVTLPAGAPVVPVLWGALLLVGAACTRSRESVLVILWAGIGALPVFVPADWAPRRALMMYPPLDLLVALGAVALYDARGAGAAATRLVLRLAVVPVFALAAGLAMRDVTLEPPFAKGIPASEELVLGKCLNRLDVWPSILIAVTAAPRTSQALAVSTATAASRPADTTVRAIPVARFGAWVVGRRGLPVSVVALSGSPQAREMERLATERVGPSIRGRSDDGCVLRLDLDRWQPQL